MTVKDWPTYLLRNIPVEVRYQLERDAALHECAMIELIREILCSHYSLDCEPVDSHPTGETLPGKDEMVLRLQPALMQAITQDAGVGYGAKRRAILSILTAHYA